MSTPLPIDDSAPLVDAPTQVDTARLHDAISFLAQLLGGAVVQEQLRAALHSIAPDLVKLDTDGLGYLMRHAHLDVSPLPKRRPRKGTEMPAILMGRDGACLVVLLIKDERFEVHIPGIAGTSWMDLEQLEREVPEARWWAVRPQLQFDQRSLLYTLPQPARWFWDVFARNRNVFAWALAGTAAMNIFGALIPFYAMAVYDRVIPHNALGSLWVLTIAVVLLTGFDFAMRVLRSHLVDATARRMDIAMSSSIFAQCLRMRAANRPASGGTLANTVRDFESIRDFFATGTLTVLGDLPFMLLYLLVIFLVGGWLSFVPLAFVPMLLGVSLLARKPLARRVSESMIEGAQRTAHLFETMNGLDTVKALGAEAWCRRKWELLTQAIAHNSYKTREITNTMSYVNNTLLGLCTVAVVATGAILMTQNALTVGQIIAVTMLSTRALTPIVQIAGLVLRWEQTRLSFQALDKVMQAPTDNQAAGMQAPPLTGELELREVTFGYPRQPPTLERLNLRIRAGERVAIIGKLGSGKSTVFRLVLNQYAPETGSVLVDGMVTAQLDPLSLRRQIGYAPQDVTLFHGSIRENIELGRGTGEDAQLVQAMRTACLDDVVAQLPQGVSTAVGERGERLSGGQRQLVALARALFMRPKLLLLDEPSSMVDPATEQRLIASLRSLERTTIVLVTHRMAMLALVDRLIVMDRGRILADGPRDEVLRALNARNNKAEAANDQLPANAPQAEPEQKDNVR